MHHEPPSWRFLLRRRGIKSLHANADWQKICVNNTFRLLLAQYFYEMFFLIRMHAQALKFATQLMGPSGASGPQGHSARVGMHTHGRSAEPGSEPQHNVRQLATKCSAGHHESCERCCVMCTCERCCVMCTCERCCVMCTCSVASFYEQAVVCITGNIRMI